MLGGDRDHDRPADVLIPNYINGKSLCVDVTIVDSFKNLSEAATTLGVNLERAEKAKQEKYEAELENLGYAFIPFAMESLGGIGKEAKQVLDFVGRALADVEKCSAAAATRRLHNCIVYSWIRDLGIALTNHGRQGFAG